MIDRRDGMPGGTAPSGARSGGRRHRRWGGAALAVAAALATACYDQAFAPNESDGRLTITNDDSELDDRVNYPNTDVPIGPPAPGVFGHSVALSRAPSSIELTLIAEVLPPTVGGQVVQATAVWATADDKAIVSYNMRGAMALGAIDYFTKLLDKTPKLKSSVSFTDSDVSSVTVDGNWAVAAIATSDTSFPSPAVMERIQIQNDKFTLAGNARYELTSFAGTSAMGTGSEVYATSGDGGDVFAFDKNSFGLLGQYQLDDARWVAHDPAGGRVVVLQGTPGRLAVFAQGEFPGGSMNLLNTFPFPGAAVAQSKSTVEVVGGKAFVAAGPDGVQIVCLDNGQIVGNVPRPDPAGLGLDSSVVVTNSVTVSGDLMFISNGEAGVYAAAADQAFDQTACDAPQQMTVLGQLQFDNLQSANHVIYRNDQLFVAAGLGGIKVVSVTVN